MNLPTSLPAILARLQEAPRETGPEIALHFGVYNFVRKHTTLRTTPAVASGIELEAWGLERVGEMTAEYLRKKEDAKFENAFAKLDV